MGIIPRAIFHSNSKTSSARSRAAWGRANPNFNAESIAKTFFTNFEKFKRRMTDDEGKKYRKQIQRLMSDMPRRQAAAQSPQNASEPGEIQKLIKHAIEHESSLKIRYQLSTGEVVDQVIEPEALQGKKVYAFCPDRDEHHMFSLERIQHAAL